MLKGLKTWPRYVLSPFQVSIYIVFCLPFPQTELQHQELNVAENKKKREKELESYRKKAEEKKEFAEKVEKRVSVY